MLLFLGFMSLLQITFLPGYLCLRVFRLPFQGPLQALVYSFALTLLSNYLLIYALYGAHLYSPQVLYLVVVLEWVILYHLLARGETVTIPGKETLALYNSPGKLLAALPALAAILALIWLCYTNFGSVFVLGDDVVSWDRWAIEWSESRFGYGSGYYPQILPANWSIPYVMMQNVDLKLFGKAIMPLFPLFTALLFLDLFHKTGESGWLLGLPSYALLLHYFFKPQFITSGYVEVPSSFCAFLALYAALQARQSRRGLLLVAVFASATMLVKQGGVYILLWALGWLAVRLARGWTKGSWRFTLLTACMVLYLNWWYVMKQRDMWLGLDHHNLVNLTQELHAGRTYPQRWAAAFQMIERIQGAELAPLFWLVCGLVLLSLFHRRGRFVLLTITAPFYVLWALLFSYEPRTLAMDLPFAGYCCGCGLEVIFRFGRSLIHRARGWGRWFAGAVLTTCLALVFVYAVPADIFRDREFYRVIWTPMIAGAGCLLLLVFSRRIWPVRFRASRALVFAAAGAVTILPALTTDPERVIQDQIEKRKQAGNAALNRKLYEYAVAHPLEGKILTDHWFLDFTPELRLHSWTMVLPSPLRAGSLRALAAVPGAGYVLTTIDKFPPETEEWMKQAGFEVIFRELNYEFVRFPEHVRRHTAAGR